jgi:hypothetical protein
MRLGSEDRMQDSAYVSGYAIQLVPTWVGVIVVAAILFGAWKLAAKIWASLSH